jgi:hypothetical protein
MFFLWQCYHLSVPVREILASRGINIPTFCPRCLAPNESLIHMLRDCPDSIAFWTLFDFHPWVVTFILHHCLIGFILIVLPLLLMIITFHGKLCFPLVFGAYG